MIGHASHHDIHGFVGVGQLGRIAGCERKPGILFFCDGDHVFADIQTISDDLSVFAKIRQNGSGPASDIQDGVTVADIKGFNQIHVEPPAAFSHQAGIIAFSKSIEFHMLTPLLQKLGDRVAETVQRLMIPVFNRVCNAVLHVICEDDSTDAVDG